MLVFLKRFAFNSGFGPNWSFHALSRFGISTTLFDNRDSSSSIDACCRAAIAFR
jgi:hypothetical protein